MIGTLVVIILGLIAFIAKMVIDINAMILQIIKDKELSKVSNPYEKNYQFIKGLY